MLIKFIGTEKYVQLYEMLTDLEEDEVDDYQLARMIVIEKGPYISAGSNQVVRDLRSYLLKQPEEETLIKLYKRNPVSGRNICSALYMLNALAEKK